MVVLSNKERLGKVHGEVAHVLCLTRDGVCNSGWQVLHLQALDRKRAIHLEVGVCLFGIRVANKLDIPIWTFGEGGGAHKQHG